LQSGDSRANRSPNLSSVVSEPGQSIAEPIALKSTRLGCEKLFEQAAAQIPFCEE
jgi:hypothetical protein